MVSKKVMINLNSGLHARPASQLVSLVKSFSSRFRFRFGEKTASGTSIISILALGLTSGSIVEVEAEGADEYAALDQVVAFLENLQE
jgi:phosphotransferase system HPr (HPr) family protein